MNKKFFIFLAFAVLTGVSARSAVGNDIPDAPHSSRSAEGTFDKHTRALELHIAGLLEKDPQKKVTCFLEAVQLDPQRKAPLLQLVKSLSAAPQRAREVLEKLKPLRSADPENIFLTLQYCRIAARAGVSPAENLKIISSVLRRKPAPFEFEDYCSLAYLWVDLSSSSGAPCSPLPFETDHLRLQSAAFYYYSICYLRERFFRSESFAQKMVKKYADILRKASLNSKDEFSKLSGILFGIKAFDLAYETAWKWYGRSRDSFAALMVINAAAQSGKIRQLELILKKYPALARDFCTQKRIEAYTAAGNLPRAYEETANLVNKTGQLFRRLNLAVMQRNAPLAVKLLKQAETLPRRNKDIIAFERLRIAEFSKDKQLLAAVKKYFAPRTEKDPSLANSIAYVSAELNTDLDEARKLMEFVLKYHPRNSAYLDSMAWVLYRQKQYREAAKYIEKGFRYLDFNSGGAVMADHAGDIYLALGQRQKALRFYLLSQELYQENRVLNSDLDAAALKKKIADLTSGKTK